MLNFAQFQGPQNFANDFVILTGALGCALRATPKCHISTVLQPFWTSMAPKYAKFHGESDGKGPEARNGPKQTKKPKKKKTEENQRCLVSPLEKPQENTWFYMNLKHKSGYGS